MRERVMDADYLRTRLLECGEATLRMRGHSMFPLLPQGSRAFLRPRTEQEDLRGAIVALEVGRQVVVHRVLRCHAGLIHTHGLSTSKRDQPSNERALIGIVSRREGWNSTESMIRNAASALVCTRRVLHALSRWRR